jgi:hypothetical protein
LRNVAERVFTENIALKFKTRALQTLAFYSDYKEYTSRSTNPLLSSLLISLAAGSEWGNILWMTTKRLSFFRRRYSSSGFLEKTVGKTRGGCKGRKYAYTRTATGIGVMAVRLHNGGFCNCRVTKRCMPESMHHSTNP